MNQLLTELKQSDQDFEFYPTTNEIIAALVRDLQSEKAHGHHSSDSIKSVLDIGAGNGKVLRALRAAKFNRYSREDCAEELFSEFYAIEKAFPLLQRLESDVFIVGTEFHEQSLVAKAVDVTFCNPPYSEFVEWTVKILRESSSRLVYLVIPTRWEESIEIAAALKYREAKAEIVGRFDFANSEDRQARAVVHLLKIELSTEKDDAFDRFFNEQFADLKAKFDAGKEKTASADKPEDEKVNPKFRGLVVGPNYPERMVALYNEELDHIRTNYDLVAQLDVDLLREFDVTPARILGCLKARLVGLRNVYWRELFGNMKQVTDRLTSKKRARMIDKLQRSGHVDFTVSNIHAVIIWVLKNANDSIDEQLIETFEVMIEKANVRNYKSNQRAFTHDRWRYSEEKPTHIALEFRLVLQHVGGINKASYERGLTESAGEFLGDILTIARNLGFDCETNDRRVGHYGRRDWESGGVQLFTFTNKGRTETLIEVRAFYNRNMHVRLNQKFALALNVEYGRLKGWLKSGAEAADELADPAASAFFNRQLRLGPCSLPMLVAIAVPKASPA